MSRVVGSVILDCSNNTTITSHCHRMSAAPYTPSSLSRWVQEDNPTASDQDIVAERARRIAHIHLEPDGQPAQAHSTFLVRASERCLAYHDLTHDIMNLVS
jgi:hypothetical protein